MSEKQKTASFIKHNYITMTATPSIWKFKVGW